MRKPNLFIVGAPKCGTTAWVSYLATHPDVFFSPAKEPHFFCTDFPNYRWAKTLSEYEALFIQSGGARIIGEASVQYLYSKVAARNIREYNRHAKILIFLRDQEDFLPSYHNQMLYNRDETIFDFECVWRTAPDGTNRDIPKTCREPALLNYDAVGRFSEQVERFVSIFPADQIKIVHFSDWVLNPLPTYRSILNFLGLKYDGRKIFERVHSAKRHRSVAIGNLTQRPPRLLLRVADSMKRLVGRERLGFANMIRKINAKREYASKPSMALREDIRSRFAADRRRLSEIVMEISEHHTD